MENELAAKETKKVKRKYGMNAELIWHDRKRYFGLPWSFTRYSLIKNGEKWFKVFSDIGLLYTIVEEVNIYRIRDISLHQTLFDKIFRTGTVTLYSNDERSPKFVLRHIAEPYKVREMFSSIIEQERQLRNIRVSEFQY